MKIDGVLVPDPSSDGTDYVMDGEACWITMGKFSLYLKKRAQGIEVECFSVGCEMDKPLFVQALANHEAMS